MIRFKQYLTELFDKPLPFEKDKVEKEHGYETHHYSFKSPGHDDERHKVRICHDRDEPHVASVIFTDFRGSVYTTHNHKGEGHKVLSTVKAIIKRHIEEHPRISRIKFSGDHVKGAAASRGSLYKKMLDKTHPYYSTREQGSYKKRTEFEVRVR